MSNPKTPIFLILASLVGFGCYQVLSLGTKIYNEIATNSPRSAHVVQVANNTQTPVVYSTPAPTLTQIASNSPTPTITTNHTSANTLTELPPGYDFFVEVSYYNPFRGGDNCFGDCETTGTDRIISNGVSVGPYWWIPQHNSGGSACPSIFNGENIRNKDIEILINNEIVNLVCMDAGSEVFSYTSNGIPIVRVDVLYDDGERTYDAPFHHPFTKGGQQFGGYLWPAKFID